MREKYDFFNEHIQIYSLMYLVIKINSLHLAVVTFLWHFQITFSVMSKTDEWESENISKLVFYHYKFNALSRLNILFYT